MADKDNYDKDLQMFRTVGGVDMERLRFLRWMCERGRLEHEVFGPSSGELVPQPEEESKEVIATP